MKYTAIAIASVPDLAGGRLIYGSDDLDDKAMGKVMQHHHRDGVPRPMQRRLRALALVRSGEAGVELAYYGNEFDENDLLRRFSRLLDTDRLLSWNGLHTLLPLLQWRGFVNGIAAPQYWGHTDDPNWHLDLRHALSLGEIASAPRLHEISLRLGLPGSPNLEQDEDDELALHTGLERRALNTFMLGIRFEVLSGRLPPMLANDLQNRLANSLAVDSPAHRARYLSEWQREATTYG